MKSGSIRIWLFLHIPVWDSHCFFYYVTVLKTFILLTVPTKCACAVKFHPTWFKGHGGVSTTGLFPHGDLEPVAMTVQLSLLTVWDLMKRGFLA